MRSSLTAQTVEHALRVMARHLKNEPKITAQYVSDWTAMFAAELSDEEFKDLARRACLTLTWFPTPAEFSAIREHGIEDDAELCWLIVLRLGKAINRRNLPDPHALWAAASIGKVNLECLLQTSAPDGHERACRAQFVRLYKIARKRGLRLADYDGKPPELSDLQNALIAAQGALEVYTGKNLPNTATTSLAGASENP